LRQVRNDRDLAVAAGEIVALPAADRVPAAE
jgi:hypothetical protein